MKHYKDPTNNALHAYAADGGQDAHIPAHLVRITDEEAEQLRKQNMPKPTAEQQRRFRQQAFAAEADPLFFKAQRGEATLQEWLAKIDEIKARFPQP